MIHEEKENIVSEGEWRGLVLFLLFILAGLSLTPDSLLADSMFAGHYLGIPVSATDARSRAMGGVSVAISGEDFSFSNPARTATFWRSGFNATVAQDYRSLKDSNGKIGLRSTEFLAFRGIFPTYKNFIVSWGIHQWRDLTWNYSDKVRLAQLPNDLLRSFSSEGGLYVSRLAVARALSSHLALGLGMDWMIGRTDRKRILGFSNASYYNSIEVINTKYSFLRPTFGLMASYKHLNLGVSVSLSRTADVDQSSAFGTLDQNNNSVVHYTDKQTYRLKYPFCWRIGGTWKITRRSAIGLEYQVERWSQSTLSAVPPTAPADLRRYSFGLELLPSASENPLFFRKFPLRFGFSHTCYPFKIGGFKVTERVFSFGGGKYFGGNVGLADIAVEFVNRKTGVAGYPEESVLRVVFSLSAFEKWVPRPRRR
ncbi:MAG: hypothetical protein DRG82_15430 [Deltaproteobacteria bacterium]|nr:MAG: hypothetical protein DRG82_15430 [Deltaproteobacteria bacterium]